MSIKIENVDVYGFEASIRGMRSPMNSWDKSDSKYEMYVDNEWHYEVGEADLKLMRNLAKAGNDHAKYLRMINVTVDITAPLYWWKEFDTYKVGTVANSCSTMHKIHSKEFELSDFSYEHLGAFKSNIGWGENDFLFALENTIDYLNVARKYYLETNDKKYWWQMIQLLPSSYNQKRTVQLNYAVLWNMYKSRKNHKLDEWVEFCKLVETLPYFKEILLGGEPN